ncbi:transcriptional repressor LexA [Clostridium chauvoei]|uniref:Transcriptional repressor LexA n=4 Tax=Clostridium chauvoei TaxID=46867 RepID=A0ABD4RDW6_9CLOT|nr:transcriptional repressor LexA [Clostridium chauvoei]ATD55117.1 repressor LexA [Clostridium chauvoei]ATD57210.1 repressor LexA [Clostridium chauvoei]MBX7279462.1 transcriptional repressor LexA [Clostridium chauvoei]MBX7282452.1 transcriptional repressor LexA [Clostridium chauvoei]MBX7285661.1 transcriptional repressor LexA [Clostridium chauvoei]
MEFSKIQNKFINQKSVGYKLLKGKEGTGKSITSIYKAINLENNYCIYEDDSILFISSDRENKDKVTSLYNLEKNKNHFYSLFSMDKGRLESTVLRDIIDTYSKAYKRENAINNNYIVKEDMINIIESLSFEIDSLAKKCKFLKKTSCEFILDEILWIRASNFTLEEYLNIDRKGREKRINRNSYTRECLFIIKDLYVNQLNKMNLSDKFKDLLYATEYVKKYHLKYTHIILDDSEKLTRGEIEFVKSIYKNSPYSSLIFIVNSELYNDEYSWLVKGRKLKTLGEDFKGKTFLYKTTFVKKEIIMPKTIDTYKYLNLKNKRVASFDIDTSSIEKEILLNDGLSFKEEELIDIPIFNDIAAGSPIEMNDSIEGDFYLPKIWLGKGPDTFILKVKGDSMINKNICDGDYVVIKKQSTANNNDIVAASLDGEATLKILNTNGENPVLTPANPLYSDINLINREVNILGVAIGVIKYS